MASALCVQRCVALPNSSEGNERDTRGSRKWQVGPAYGTRGDTRERASTNFPYRHQNTKKNKCRLWILSQSSFMREYIFNIFLFIVDSGQSIQRFLMKWEKEKYHLWIVSHFFKIYRLINWRYWKFLETKKNSTYKLYFFFRNISLLIYFIKNFLFIIKMIFIL